VPLARSICRYSSRSVRTIPCGNRALGVQGNRHKLDGSRTSTAWGRFYFGPVAYAICGRRGDRSARRAESCSLCRQRTRAVLSCVEKQLQWFRVRGCRCWVAGVDRHRSKALLGEPPEIQRFGGSLRWTPARLCSKLGTTEPARFVNSLGSVWRRRPMVRLAVQAPSPDASRKGSI